MSVLIDQVYAALAQFTSASRLYELTIGKADSALPHGLFVEAFAADDGVQGAARAI